MYWNKIFFIYYFDIEFTPAPIWNIKWRYMLKKIYQLNFEILNYFEKKIKITEDIVC